MSGGVSFLMPLFRPAVFGRCAALYSLCASSAKPRKESSLWKEARRIRFSENGPFFSCYSIDAAAALPAFFAPIKRRGSSDLNSQLFYRTCGPKQRRLSGSHSPLIWHGIYRFRHFCALLFNIRLTARFCTAPAEDRRAVERISASLPVCFTRDGRFSSASPWAPSLDCAFAVFCRIIPKDDGFPVLYRFLSYHIFNTYCGGKFYDGNDQTGSPATWYRRKL